MKVFRSLIILFLVVGLTLGAALPVSANTSSSADQPQVSVQFDKGKPENEGKGPWAEGKVKVIRGEVASIGSDNLTVDSRSIVVGGETTYKVPGLDKEAKLSDIKVGMQIVALCYEKDGKLYARQITVIASRLSYGHHVGEVVTYNAGDNITIKDKWNNIVTFKIGENFKILPKGTAVNTGDQVTVITRAHPLTGDRIAFGVVVHHQKPKVELQSISGNITAMTSANMTVDGTVLSYNTTTIFVLRGIAAAPVGGGYGFPLTGQQATVFYREEGGAKFAKLVLVGINIPEALREIGTHEQEGEDGD